VVEHVVVEPVVVEPVVVELGVVEPAVQRQRRLIQFQSTAWALQQEVDGLW
jgi:hypothetical protein